MWRLHEAAGLPRISTIAWNIVPWYVGTDTKIRPVGGDDLQAAAPHLAALIALLPDLRVVVSAMYDVTNPRREIMSVYLVTEDYGEWTPVGVYLSFEDAKALVPGAAWETDERGVTRNLWGQTSQWPRPVHSAVAVLYAGAGPAGSPARVSVSISSHAICKTLGLAASPG